VISAALYIFSASVPFCHVMGSAAAVVPASRAVPLAIGMPFCLSLRPENAYSCYRRLDIASSLCARNIGRWRVPSTANNQPDGKRLKLSKQRLDDYCMLQHPQYSKNVIQMWIADGKVSHFHNTCLCSCAREYILTCTYPTA
jgi:hypothetical protein